MASSRGVIQAVMMIALVFAIISPAVVASHSPAPAPALSSDGKLIFFSFK